MRSLRIATRKSPLALWQANHVSALLREAVPGVEVSLLEMSTEGDRFLSGPLLERGGKGLFVKEIEQALVDGQADLAVHSLKDMTSQLPEGLELACVPAREDARDAFVGRGGARFVDLPRGAQVGTSSLRRSCQLRAARPDLRVVPLRGNVQTRLRKVTELGLDGAVLALAGLRRLGLDGLVTEVLDPELCLPAVGQGALAIECRAADAELKGWLARIEDARTRVEVTAERAFLAKLEGGCSVPLAAHAVLSDERLFVRARVGSADGAKLLRAERGGAPSEASSLGEALADSLLALGAKALLSEVPS